MILMIMFEKNYLYKVIGLYGFYKMLNKNCLE